MIISNVKGKIKKIKTLFFFRKTNPLSANTLIINPTRKNLRPLAKKALKMKTKKSNFKKPLVIVMILNGIGVKPPIMTEYIPHLL
ncbi:hypothetical protein OAB63_00040 [Alphaproteobacteria bacterium]|nr:hypothetical protein [Alphaproteobacteria bacterium]